MNDKAKEAAPPIKTLRASMSVVLKANEVVVAEVDDPALWSAVFSAINNGSSVLLPSSTPAPPTPAPRSSADDVVRNTPATEPIDKFAKELEVDSDVLRGACDPTSTDPYLRLDLHHWEKMKKDLPTRGRNAVPPIVTAATLLCLWARHASLATVTQAQAQSVLSAINLRDANPTRGIAAADWLQSRPGGQIVINPSRISKAICFANAFCKKDWSAWKAQQGDDDK